MHDDFLLLLILREKKNLLEKEMTEFFRKWMGHGRMPLVWKWMHDFENLDLIFFFFLNNDDDLFF